MCSRRAAFFARLTTRARLKGKCPSYAGFCSAKRRAAVRIDVSVDFATVLRQRSLLNRMSCRHKQRYTFAILYPRRTIPPLCLALALFGCGARTGLEVDRFDAGPDMPGLPCLGDGECDDEVECTENRCVAGRCVTRALNERCEDGVFCNGPARCTTGGCVAAPVPCDDGVSCTVDACDEGARACTHTPDVDLCPISHRCDPIVDCAARALVNDDTTLFEVDLPSGATRRIAALEVPLTDLALHPDGRLFGVNRMALYEIDETTGRARRLAGVPARLVALEVGPDGALYGAGDTEIVRIDPSTFAVRRIGGLPSGLEVSGDVAFVDGELYITATRTPFSIVEPDTLVRVPGDGADVIEVGSTGSACIWALAPFGDTLYGLTCTGRLTVIDVRTGTGRVLESDLSIRCNGAAAR